MGRECIEMEKDKVIGDLVMKRDGTQQSISGPGMRVDRTEQARNEG